MISDSSGVSVIEFGATQGCRMTSYRQRPHRLHFMHILESDPAILEYLAHPRLVAMAEELVGGTVRLEESEASINSRDRREQTVADAATARYGFHAGSLPDLGTYNAKGLYHGTFVKTLTNLTPLGPDDGGTTVVGAPYTLQLLACMWIADTTINCVWW
eukprot:SAG31_NODE_4897_length_2879_cov_1.749281_1_plen_159_part_00